MVRLMWFPAAGNLSSGLATRIGHIDVTAEYSIAGVLDGPVASSGLLLAIL
jgi:hypothetical protein